jgi:hypothetical protein
VTAKVALLVAAGNGRTTTGFVVVARDFNKTPGEFAVEMIGKAGFDVASNPVVGRATTAFGVGYSIASEPLK